MPLLSVRGPVWGTFSALGLFQIVTGRKDPTSGMRAGRRPHRTYSVTLAPVIHVRGAFNMERASFNRAGTASQSEILEKSYG